MTRDGTRIALFDRGGSGPNALLLHGLAGRAREWDGTAEWLGERFRVLAPDQRGHGLSERRPADVSRDAYVEDAAALAEEAGGPFALVIGQSLGGQTAFLLAARHPELVERLVVVEAGPAADAGAPARVRAALAAWPAGAERFFDDDVMVAAVGEVAERDHWAEWERVRCPTLVVRGTDGDLSAEEAELMRRRNPRATVRTVSGAGHDVHLDRPDEFRQAVLGFTSPRGT